MRCRNLSSLRSLGNIFFFINHFTGCSTATLIALIEFEEGKLDTEILLLFIAMEFQATLHKEFIDFDRLLLRLCDSLSQNKDKDSWDETQRSLER